MPDRKRVGLERPSDLLAKLHWEIEQLRLPVDQEAIASYRAFNCAVTAWSICDWVWHAAAPELRERFRAESPNPNANGSEPLASLVRERSRELVICQQLANGSKHFILDRHNDPTVSSCRLPGVVFDFSDGLKRQGIPTHSVLILDGDRTYLDVFIFYVAYDFWTEFFKRYGIGVVRN